MKKKSGEAGEVKVIKKHADVSSLARAFEAPSKTSILTRRQIVCFFIMDSPADQTHNESRASTRDGNGLFGREQR